MKKLLIALAAVLVTATTFGQGTLNFSTKVGTDVDAPVVIAGTQNGPGPLWSAQLYLSSNGSLTALTPATTFRDGSANPAAAKYVVPAGTVTVPGVNSGNPASIVMRAWLTSLNGFDAAKASGSGLGESAPLTVTLGGGLLPDANLSGLQGFSVSPANVPEPSIIALGVLGASALLLRRRK